MRVLVTGSSGHLGEALMRILPAHGVDPVGIDIKAGPYTTHPGSITDRALVRRVIADAKAVLHTATLHKPHVATHSKQDFVDTNISGTLVLLEEALAAGIDRFIFTSTTSAFGAALSPGPGEAAAWIDESVASIPKNIYGATKTSAEDLCHLFQRLHGVNSIVLRTSRFFPEDDDNRVVRDAFDDQNAKANEYLYRRVDLEDAASAHIAAIEKAPEIGFGRYIISATTPFQREDLAALRTDPTSVVAARVPDFQRVYDARGFAMFASIGRVYDNTRARADLGWTPAYGFDRVLQQLAANQPIGSELARMVGAKGYHDQVFKDGPFPVA